MRYSFKLLSAILRQDLPSFINKVFSTINPCNEYFSNWHIELIADYLELVRFNKINRLIINIPPRHLKSLCVSVAFPAWLLGHNPGCRIMAASYSSVLSTKHSVDTRFILLSDWYKNLFTNTILSKTHNQKSKFLTNQNGFRFATSVGGSATGEGGDVLIIDDPHNPVHINSQKARNKVIDWFENTFATRLNNKNTGAIILVMQRLHQNDLAGYLLSSGSWELLKIPIIAQKDIAFSVNNKKYEYKKGEILNSKLDNSSTLKKLEGEIGVANYHSQYLQEPLVEDYSILSKSDITLYSVVPDGFEYFVLSWDTAIKISKDADFTVCTCWGIYNNHYYLVDLIREKMTYPVLKLNIEKQSKKYMPKYILIEDKASGQSVIQDLMLDGLHNIRAIKPINDKITRFTLVAPMFRAGQVLIPEKSRYSLVVLNELTTFPHSKHDDIVDSVSQFLQFSKLLLRKSSVNIRQI
ncbi:phage terminase large subunit [Rickettsia endosymbiont of Cardiosporidium cionae]|uniref:phage terminase large subunit n=1 Tax=Rickettsia endosymbiont of Cardiosporidium cionae TaxID=2777155 RepID=UPI00189394CE|nr:phage terminase large subunit [Rickettsia endosymbiont of Cardiosporidium cionae]KAF8818499.1 terminase [Rickettsia endosymbiont of Cardiosporidium cionae]